MTGSHPTPSTRLAVSLHVTLVQPPTTSTPTLRAQEAVPPLGLAYVAAAVQRAGHALTVIDAVGEALDQFSIYSFSRRTLLRGLSAEEITARVPAHTRVIGVSCMFTNGWPPVRALIEQLKRARPTAYIVLGGEHATACHEHILKTCSSVDFCVLGEGEKTFCELLNYLAQGQDPSDIAGVASRSSRRETRDSLAALPPTQRRPRTHDIGSIPLPAWDLFPLERYLDAGCVHGISRGRTMPILASRGCPYQCTFCSSPNMWTTKWIARAPSAVVDEIKLYQNRYGATDFSFYDLTAIVSRQWILEFCQQIIDEGLQITWQLPSGTRSEAIDKEIARLLFRSGCRNIDYAPESGAPSVLTRIKKRVHLGRMVRSIRDAVDSGIQVRANIIVGFPDETQGEILQSVRFIARLAMLGVDSIGVFPFCPYPGSLLFDDLVARGKVRLDEAYFEAMVITDIAGTSYNERFSPRQLLAYVMLAQVVFYTVQTLLHPSRVARLALSLARRDPKSKIAMGFEAMRLRHEQWGTLARSHAMNAKRELSRSKPERLSAHILGLLLRIAALTGADGPSLNKAKESSEADTATEHPQISN